jgi:hypothetical protein
MQSRCVTLAQPDELAPQRAGNVDAVAHYKVTGAIRDVLLRIRQGLCRSGEAGLRESAKFA